MLTARRLPMPKITPHGVPMGAGLDTESASSEVKPGAARGALNYEAAFGGGYDRVRGFERFDGRTRPSDAALTYLVPTAEMVGVVAGDVLTGATSGATGTVVYAVAAFVVLTAVTGTFSSSEVIRKSGTPVGTNTASTPATTLAQENVFYAAAADVYRALIQQVPGSGAIRGIATLGDHVYAWRDTADGLAGEIYKDSASGWVVVPRYYVYSFTGGGTAYTDGSTLTQGAVTATVKRVVLTSGAWGGTAVGKLVTTIPTGGAGNFANGAAAGTGTCTLASVAASAALAQVTLAPGGRVETIAFNFGGATGTRRLYGCDGVNAEFEFDGDVLVPLSTGMTNKASFVAAHRNYLWYAYGSSLQKSSIGSPYVWSAVLGAAEIAVGDDITGMAASPGNQDTSSLTVTCSNSTYVLYGSTSADFKLDRISDEAGAMAYSLKTVGQPLGYDAQGFRVIKPTQSFGNFQWDSASRKIDSLVRGKTPVCSVFTPTLSRYRCFFSDGSVLSGTPGSKEIAWTTLQYGVNVVVAHSGEVAGAARTFYGSDDGWVFEADVGRSFDGETIVAALRMATIDCGSPMMEKRFRSMDIEVDSESAFTLYASAELNDGSTNNEPVSSTSLSMPGPGGQWDISLWNASRWDAGTLQRRMVDMPGVGYGIAPIFYTSSANELPNRIRAGTLLYSMTKVRK